jgi:DNA-binding YbaB/EbfC family protein
MMSQFGQFMKQAQDMQKKMNMIQESLALAEFVGSAGGDLAKVTISGDGKAKSVWLSPSILTSADDKEMLEDLITAAINDAIQKKEKFSESSMSEVFGGLSLPPGFKMPF